MPSASRDPVLHRRRIIAGAEHHLVVVRLQDHRRDLAEVVPEDLGGPAEIVGHAEAGAVHGGHGERERFGRVVEEDRSGQRERPALGPAGAAKRQGACPWPGAERRPGAPGGPYPAAESPGKTDGAPGMVAVLVGERDAAQGVQVHARAHGAAYDLPRAEARVEQQGPSLGDERAAVAARSRAQNGERGHRASLACSARREASSRGPTSIRRLGITRLAILTKPSTSSNSAPAAPHANGGTQRGTGAPITLAPAPMAVPVDSRVPIAVLAWSPIRAPRLVRRGAPRPPGRSSRTSP